MKKIMKGIVLIAVLAALCFSLIACGEKEEAEETAVDTYTMGVEAKQAASVDMLDVMEIPEEELNYAAEDGGEFYSEDYDAVSDESASGSVYRPNSENVKLVYTASVNLETEKYLDTLKYIEKLVEEQNGYIESASNDTNGYDEETFKTAYYTVRVPAENYEAFLAALGSGEDYSIRNVSRRVEDIGQQYYDTESRLKTLEKKRDRLQELLDQAESMEDIIAIESALSDVESEIENYTSEMNRYDGLVGYATIDISVQEVKNVTATGDTTNLGERIAAAFTNGLAAVGTFFEDLLIFLAAAWLPLLIIAAIIVLIVCLVCRKRRKNKTKKEAGKEEIKEKSETESEKSETESEQ